MYLGRECAAPRGEGRLQHGMLGPDAAAMRLSAEGEKKKNAQTRNSPYKATHQPVSDDGGDGVLIG